MRSGDFGLADRIIVGGGGGGAGGFFGGAGGFGGGSEGGPGANGRPGEGGDEGGGGGGGTSTEGGAGGVGRRGGSNGDDGDIGTGGSGGGASCTDFIDDGGGGGGYYGGGGGGGGFSGGGGGGGSGFGPSGVVFSDGGVRSGNGLVTITYTLPDTTPDTTAPKVRSTFPPNGGEVGPAANITATFSEDMRPASVKNAFKLFRKGSTNQISAQVSYSARTRTATLNPTNNLKREATYKAVVSTVAKDLAGNRLDQNSSKASLQQKVWFFEIDD